MKRLLGIVLICALCVGFMGIAQAADTEIKDNNAEDYRTVTKYYKNAVAFQDDGEFDEAIGQLNSLIRYCDKHPSSKEYMDIPEYYAYALGRIELHKEEPDFATAYEKLKELSDKFYLVDSYRQYANGMMNMAIGEYQSAYADLQAAKNKLPEYTQKIINAITECTALYKSSVLSKGKAACQNGNHEKALEIYNQYLSLFDMDTEIRSLRDECQNNHSSEDAVEEVGLEMISAVPSAQRAVKLTWKGIPEVYSVQWTSDLVHGRDQQTEPDVNGKSYTVTGLLPGTVYRFTVSCRGVSVQINRETPKAPEYPPAEGEDEFWTGSSSLFRFDNSRYDFMASGKTSYEFSNDKSCKYLKTRTVELLEKPIYESCILFVFTTFGVPDDIEGKDYQLLLHINEVATLTENGVWGAAGEDGVVKVCANGSYIYVLVYDLFDRAIEEYSDLSEKSFRLDLLVDGLLVAFSEGVLQ